MTPTAQPEITITDGERDEALGLLRDPRLLDRIAEDAEVCGIVGEKVNILVAYLASVSRLLDRPLAVVIQSTSAGGKSTVMDAVLNFTPPEQRVQFSAMTPQSLYYLGEQGLRNKVLAISEEEGASKAAYPLKLLQSERELRIASTEKDSSTGRLVTKEYRVAGPVSLMFTTTSIDLDAELMNRCLVLAVDESQEQTAAIHRLQRERETLEGLLAARRREAIARKHQNAQRLLRPLTVVNPHAGVMTFTDTRTRARRDLPKLLALARAIALLHQHQRPIKTVADSGKVIEYVEVEASDIEAAQRLAAEVLGWTMDELPPHTRRLLAAIQEMVAVDTARLGIEQRDYRFTTRQLRERLGVGHSQLQVHLRRLVELEHLAVHRAVDGRGHAFELLDACVYDDHHPGLEPIIRGASGVGAGCSKEGSSAGEDSGSNGAGGHHPGHPVTTSGGYLGPASYPNRRPTNGGR